MNEVCRICLSCPSGGDVKFSNLSDTKEGQTVAQVIGFISSIEISAGDGLPQTVCLSCITQVRAAVNVKNRVLETDKILRASIKIESPGELPLIKVEDLETIPNPVELSLLTVDDLEQLTNIEDFKLINIKKIHKKPVTKPVAKHRFSNSASEKKCERKNKTPIEEDYKCFICDLLFEKISTKNNHVKTKHKQERICRICQAKCKTPLSLETHIKFHSRDYGYMCEICSKTFRYRNRLNSHMALHHAKAVEMTCDLCGLSTKFKNNIKRHMKSVHMKLREFQCDKCTGHEYSTQEALNSHLYRYHNVAAPITCPDCNHAGFTFDSELRAHKKHGFCSNNANSPTVKRGKIQYEHLEILDNTGEHVCKLCKIVFQNKNKWSMHNYLKHKYSNKCEACNVVFTNYTSLIRHEKVKHLGHKPFECDLCLKTFGQKVSLISHRNTHTGEKSFGCSFCSFRSGDHGTVSKHKKRMHPEMMTSTSKSILHNSI